MKVCDCLDILEIRDTVQDVPKVVSPALLHDNSSLILVDTGYPGQLSLFERAFHEAGVPLDSLTGIVLTHQDLDHIGSFADILDRVPHEVTTMAHELDKPYIEGKLRPVKLAQIEAMAEPVPPILDYYRRLGKSFRQSEKPIDRALRDGEILPFCGGLTVIHTPGHTPGHICLYLQKEKLLLCGDMLKVQGGELTRNNPIHNQDQNRYLSSLEKLTGWNIQAIVCYHGGVYSGHSIRDSLQKLSSQ